MTGTVYPEATYRPMTFYSDAGVFNQAQRGWILHVVQGNGSPYNYFQGSRYPGRKFSHFWVSKAGTVEQYAPINYKGWAQSAGNAEWWSVETEGFPTEPLNPKQIEALARLHIWLGADDKWTDDVGGTGIGVHSMGGSAWGGHACPGNVRAAQRVAILSRVTELRVKKVGSMLTPQEIDALATAVVSKLLLTVIPSDQGAADPNFQMLLARVYKATVVK